MIESKKWSCGLLSLILFVAGLSGLTSTGLASANGGGSAYVYNTLSLPANDSAELRAEIGSYDTNNQVVDMGFQVWPVSDGISPPLNAATIQGVAGPESTFYGYAIGLADNTEYYFRPFVETADGLFSYGTAWTITTATTAAMNGQKWIASASFIEVMLLENGTPAIDVEWPEEVEVVFTDGSKKTFPIVWKDKEDYESIIEDGGNKGFEGEIVLPIGGTDVVHPYWPDGLPVSFIIKVKESNIVAVDAVPDLTVPVGTTLQQIIDGLPEKVGVDLANGKRKMPSADWDSGTPAFVPNAPGTYTFIGELRQGDSDLRNDDGLTATVIVHVVPYLWQLVGRAGFTDSAGDSVSFVFDNNGTPYVAFKDSAAGGAVSVMKFDGTDWVYAGAAGFSGGNGGAVSLAYDNEADKLYVAYSDGAKGGAVTVREFDPLSNQWTLVGTAGFSGGAASAISLATDPNNQMLFVAYADGGAQGRVSVMSFDGTVWSAVGTSGFSAGAVRAVTITAIYGSVMLTYEDAVAPHAAYAWTKEVYEAVFTAREQPAPSSSYLAHASGDYQKHVVYKDQQGVHFKDYDYAYGTWNDGANGAFTSGPVHALDLIVARTGKYSFTPYVAYTDSADGDKVTVKLLQDGEWVAVGNTAFTAGAAPELKLRFANGTPYVAIKDGAQGGKLTVLKYAPVEWPVVQTLTVEDIRMTAASVGGNLLAEGIPPATERGVVYSVSPNPALGGPGVQSLTDAGIGAGAYRLPLSQLLPGTKYYVRAYAISPKGTAYGYVVEFTTPSASNNSGSTAVESGPLPPKTLTVTVRDANSGATQPKDTKITQLIGDALDMKAQLLSADGKALNIPEFAVRADGTFELPNVPAGQYRMLLQVVAPTGERLAGTLATLTVTADGNVTIDAELIDPYGIITDSVTGKPVDGVKVTLHWTDTGLNRSKGRTPHELIVLPILPDFPPNQNADPQYSRDGGQYGWMVFPDGDYYILAEKEGYEPFDSRDDPHEAAFGDDSYIRDGNIHVGRTIVKYDFEIDPILKATGEHKPYMRGYPDGNFLPESGISRAELAAILSRTMTDGTAVGNGNAGFTDVAAKHWAAGDIRVASDRGWLKGNPGGKFQPERKLTRAELAQVLVRLPVWATAAGTEKSFTDVDGHWAAGAIADVAGSGLLDGFPDGSFRPDQPITRQETVRIFNALLGRTPERDGIVPYWPDVPETHQSFVDIMEASLTHRYALYETGVEIWLP